MTNRAVRVGMSRAIVVVVLALLALVSWRDAGAVEASELWMWSTPANAPDDAIAEESPVGLMASGAVCSGVAEAMTAWMARDRSKVVAVFECRVRTILIEAN